MKERKVQLIGSWVKIERKSFFGFGHGAERASVEC